MPNQSVKHYEVTFILNEQAGEKEAQDKAKAVTELIKSLGGQVTKQELWGRRELAYPIRRNRSGFYATLWAELPPQQVKPLERELRFDEAVIRSLVTVAYTTAQPGSLYPVAEEESAVREPRRSRQATEAPASAEAELRRSATKPVAKKTEKPEDAGAVSEEERLQRLDAALGDILKEEE